MKVSSINFYTLNKNPKSFNKVSFLASAKNSKFDSFERNTQELQTDKGAIVNTEIKQLLYKAKMQAISKRQNAFV